MRPTTAPLEPSWPKLRHTTTHELSKRPAMSGWTDSPRKVGIARHPPKLTTKTAHFALQYRPRDTVV